MDKDHSIKIYTNESIINIDDYKDTTYKKAESQCKLAGYIKDYESERLDGYWIVPNESKDYSIAIHYNTNSKIEYINIHRNNYIKIEVDNDIIIERQTLKRKDDLHNIKLSLQTKHMYISLYKDSIQIGYLR
jgi:hypothetical protein